MTDGRSTARVAGETESRRVYSPSPRPTFDRPTSIPYRDVTRYIWGDDVAGEVTDWIYVSSGAIHGLVFGLAAGESFTHSSEFRTVFGADEVLHVLSGTMVIANPETGDVHRVEKGGRIAFGPNTWHHAFAHGGEPLRVLELFAPPPSTGTSGVYARNRPFLELADSRYADDSRLGVIPGPGISPSTFRPIGPADIVWRRDLGILTGVLSSTSQLTVLTAELNPGDASTDHSHGGDAIVYVTSGTVWVKASFGGESFNFELHEDDAAFLPRGSVHSYRNKTGSTAEALIGVAPSYLP